MPERGPHIQYHGIPEKDRSSRDAARDADVRRELVRMETFGYRIPEAWMPIVDKAIESVNRVAAACGAEGGRVNRDRIFVVRDTLYTFQDDGADVLGEFRATSDVVYLRATHFFAGDHGEDGIFRKTRAQEYELYRNDFIRIFNDPAEQEKGDIFKNDVLAVGGCHALFSLDEVLDLFFAVPIQRTQIRQAIKDREPQLRALFPNLHGRIGAALAAAAGRSDGDVMVFGELVLQFSEKQALSEIMQAPKMVITAEVQGTLAHEVAHAMSWAAISEFANGRGTRVGYKIPGKNQEVYFVSLNEAVAESVAQEAVAEGASGEQAFFVTDGSYRSDRLLLQTIIRRIAENNREAAVDVWKRFKKGLFTGNIMHVRDIEKAFGREAWDYYKTLGPDTLRKPSRKTRAEVKRLFGLALPR